MRKLIMLTLVAFMLVCNVSKAFAEEGIKRNQWDYGPEIAFGSVLYGTLLSEGIYLLYSSIFGEDRPCWAPNVISKATIDPTGYFYTMKENDRGRLYKHRVFNGSSKKTKWYNPDLKNLSVGYGVNYMSKELPIGFSAKLSYEQVGWDKYAGDKDDMPVGTYKFRKRMIVPEAILKIRVGTYRKGEANVCIDLGGSYDYVIGGKCFSYGKNAYNSGFSTIMGFSIADPITHFQVGGDIYIPTYKCYKRIDGLSFDGGKSTAISFYIRLGV